MNALALLITVCDPAFAEIVGRKLDGDLVSWQNADEMAADFSRNVSQNFVTVG